MAKKSGKLAPAENRKIQEIIGRAFADKKFLTSLKKAPKKTLAKYELEPQSLEMIEKGLKAKAQLDELMAVIKGDFGVEVQGS